MDTQSAGRDAKAVSTDTTSNELDLVKARDGTGYGTSAGGKVKRKGYTYLDSFGMMPGTDLP